MKISSQTYLKIAKVFGKDYANMIAFDEEIWRTTKEGENGGGGKHYAIETETGKIVKGNIGQPEGGAVGGIRWPFHKDKAESKKPKSYKDWQSKIPKEKMQQLDYIDQLQLQTRKPNDIMVHPNSSFANKYFELIASATDWNEKVKNHQFDRLDDNEKENINKLLSKCTINQDGNPEFVQDFDYQAKEDITAYLRYLELKELGLDENVSEIQFPKAFETEEKFKGTTFKDRFDNGKEYAKTEKGDASRQSVKDAIKTSANFEQIPDHCKEEIYKRIEEMDDNVAEQLSQTIDKVSVQHEKYRESVDGGGNCECVGTTLLMSMWPYDPTKYGDEHTTDESFSKIYSDTFFHELGHAIDNANPCNYNYNEATMELSSNSITKQLSSSGEYKANCEQDINNMFALCGLDEKYVFFYDNGVPTIQDNNNFKSYTPFSSDKMPNDLTAIGKKIQKTLYKKYGIMTEEQIDKKFREPEKPNFYDYGFEYSEVDQYGNVTEGIIGWNEDIEYDEEGIPHIVSMEGKYKEAIKEYENKKQKFDKKYPQDLIEKLKKENEEKIVKFYDTFSYLNDIFGEATHGMLSFPVGGSHKSFYYQKWDSMGYSCIETTANFYNAIFSGKRDMLAFLKEYFPNNYRSYISLITEAGKNVRKYS